MARQKAQDSARGRGKHSHSPLCGKRAGGLCDCGRDVRAKATENALEYQLALHGIRVEAGRFEREAEFIPGRHFRGDFVHYAAHLVIEVQGWAGGYGPHGGIGKAKRDVEKLALAAAFGWRVLPCTRDTIKSGEAVRLILAAIAWKPQT